MSEITLEKAAGEMTKALQRAGFAALATGLHFLRGGGATAYFNVSGGGELIATAVGGWKS